MNEIIIRELTFQYDKHMIFDQIDLDVKEASFTTVLGNGKTTFAHIIAGLLPYKGYINMNKTVLDKTHVRNLRQFMGFVLGSESLYFTGETVLDEIVYVLENIGMRKSEIKKRVQEMDGFFNIQKYFNVSPLALTNSKKALVALISAIIHEPKILVLDDAFVMMDEKDKKKALTILKKYNRENKMLILNMTNDMEESLYGKDILIFHEGKILLHGSKENIYQEEKKLNEIGIDLPFMVDLSTRLSYYDLVDHIILDMKEMVKHLWK